MKDLELCVLRYNGTKGFTTGRLFADGEFICYTLEDEVREIRNKQVTDWKIYGSTAIPRGCYEVKLTLSPKFKRILPELFNVPGFTAIRGHSGNRIEDTEGCILFGMNDGNDRDAWLGVSKIAENNVVTLLRDTKNAGRKCFITVV